MNPCRSSDSSSIGFQRLSVITVFVLVVLVTVGGVVRVTESGLGCPDWPLCHGQIVPPGNLETRIEYSHRLIASIAGLLSLVMTVWVWAKYRDRLIFLIPSSVGLVLVVGQGVLGGITVLTELESELVTAHLALAQLLLALYILVALFAVRGGTFSISKIDRVGMLAIASAVLVYLLLLSGSIVTTSGASGVCNGWPFCQGVSFMSDRLTIIHMIHRYIAIAAGCVVLTTIWLTIKTFTSRSYSGIVSLVTGVLFLGQVFVGAIAVLGGLPSELRALHLTLGTLAWGSLIVMALLHCVDTSKPSMGNSSNNDDSSCLATVIQ